MDLATLTYDRLTALTYADLSALTYLPAGAEPPMAPGTVTERFKQLGKFLYLINLGQGENRKIRKLLNGFVGQVATDRGAGFSWDDDAAFFHALCQTWLGTMAALQRAAELGLDNLVRQTMAAGSVANMSASQAARRLAADMALTGTKVQGPGEYLSGENFADLFKRRHNVDLPTVPPGTTPAVLTEWITSDVVSG